MVVETRIGLSKKTKEDLINLKKFPSESYDSIVQCLVNNNVSSEDNDNNFVKTS